MELRGAANPGLILFLPAILSQESDPLHPGDHHTRTHSGYPDQTPYGGADTSQPQGGSPFCFAELTAKQQTHPLRALCASAVHHSYPLNGSTRASPKRSSFKDLIPSFKEPKALSACFSAPAHRCGLKPGLKGFEPGMASPCHLGMQMLKNLLGTTPELPSFHA